MKGEAHPKLLAYSLLSGVSMLPQSELVRCIGLLGGFVFYMAVNDVVNAESAACCVRQLTVR